jgi:tripartite-type tricarboxylate transporter receptor subunit TctC
VIAPAGVPQPIIDKLSADVRAVVASREFAEKTKNLGINAWGNSPSELDTWFRQEIEKWAAIAKAANLKAE